MTKILFVSTVASMFRTFLLPFARHYRERGWEVHAVSRGAAECPVCRENFDRVFEMNWTRKPTDTHFLDSYGQIQRLVAEHDYDIINTTSPIASFITRVALRARGRRPAMVYTARGFHFNPQYSLPINAAFLTLEKIAGHWTDVLITVNEWDTAMARKYRLAPWIELIPGSGPDMEALDPARIPAEAVAAVRAEMGLDPAATLFLCVAEFNENKRQRDLVSALARLQAPEVHLAFAGAGDKLPEVQALAEELGVGRQAHFLGFRKDVPALMRASRAVVLASRREGLPRCILEAQCLEVPAIGSDIRGTRDLVSEGRGLAVPVGDVAGWTRALERLWKNPAEAAAMGRKGRELVGRHDIRRIIASHDVIFDELLRRQAGKKP